MSSPNLIARFSNLHLLTKLVLALLFVSLVWSILTLVYKPSARIGILGMGLPAQMIPFQIDRYHVSILHPESWVAFETPQGNHGDDEVIATISIPTRWWFYIDIAERDFLTGGMDQVSAWGESRMREGATLVKTLQPVKTKTLSGQMLEYSFQQTSPIDQSTAFCKDFFFLDHARGFALSFCADSEIWDQFDPVIKEMVDSFKVE